MSEDLRNLIQREVARALKRRGWPRIGLVDSYDPTRHAVKVNFPDEAKLSGWLPIGSAWTGNGWGLHMAPIIGAQVVVAYHDGDPNAGFVSHQLVQHGRSAAHRCRPATCGCSIRTAPR